MKTLSFYYLLVLILLCSCETAKKFSQSDVETIFTEKELHSSTVLQSQKIIKLENSSNAAIIKNAQRIFCTDICLFILDIDNNKLVSFDYNGRFLKSSLGLIGRAKNEYIHIHDAAIDNIKHLIYLYCDIPYQMLVLDYNMNVKECIKMKDLFAEFSIDSENVYALCPDIENESHYELRLYKRDCLDGDYIIIKDQKEAICRVKGLGKWINGNGNLTYASMPFDHTIYEIENGSIKRSWSFDFDGKWFDYSQNKKLKGSRFIDANDDKHWTIQNIIASDTTLLFNTNQSNVFKTSTLSGKCYGFPNLINDSIPFSSSWMIPTNLKNGVAFLIPSSNIVEYNNFYARRNKSLPANPINRIIEGTTEEDNPIIILGSIR